MENKRKATTILAIVVTIILLVVAGTGIGAFLIIRNRQNQQGQTAKKSDQANEKDTEQLDIDKEVEELDSLINDSNPDDFSTDNLSDKEVGLE